MAKSKLGTYLLVFFVLGASMYIAYPYIQGIINSALNVPETDIDYKAITVQGSVLNEQGAAIGASVTVYCYNPQGAVVASAVCDAAGAFSFSIQSGSDYWFFAQRTASASWDLVFDVSVPAVAQDSEVTTYTLPEALVLPTQATVYTHYVTAGGITNSRTQAAGVMTGGADYPAVAGTNIDFVFSVLTGAYSSRSQEWFMPTFYSTPVYGVYLICSNMTFNVVSCPYEYITYQAAGVANYSLAFKASPASAGASASTIAQTLTFNWATAIGSPSFEVYFLWNTTVSTLKNALVMGGAAGAHLAAAGVAVPLGYTSGGLFQITDGTYADVETA